MHTVDLSTYSWNNRTVFDAHRTMSLALLHPDNDTVLGHLAFVINQDYLLEGVLRPMLEEEFGDASQAGMVVWVRNWILGENLLSNNEDRKSTRLNSSHVAISYAVFCLKKKNKLARTQT